MFVQLTKNAQHICACLLLQLMRKGREEHRNVFFWVHNARWQIKRKNLTSPHLQLEDRVALMLLLCCCDMVWIHLTPLDGNLVGNRCKVDLSDRFHATMKRFCPTGWHRLCPHRTRGIVINYSKVRSCELCIAIKQWQVSFCLNQMREYIFEECSLITAVELNQSYGTLNLLWQHITI